MSIINRAFLIFTLLFTVLIAQKLTAQQQPPYGSCMITGGNYDGLWCWPLVPGSFGDPCVCPSPDGDQSGVIQ